MSRNRGDTLYLELDYTVNGLPIQEGDWDEIEFRLGSNRYLLSEGDIEWDSEIGKYVIFADQEDTFKLIGNVFEYQIRLRKGKEVVSDDVQRAAIGKTISQEII